MTRVIHTGDTHLGYQQYHSPERREDFMRAFERVVDDAIEADVDAVVHAGDLFHDRRPELRDLLGTISALRRLEEAGVPFLAIVGNHESTRGGQWLDLLARLGLATRLSEKPVVVGDVAVYGLDHVPRSRRSDLEYDFADHDAAFAALVAHGLFEPFPHGDWDAETVLTEASVDFDAMLLGDNHAPETATVAGTWVTYCGSTERASASERDARGYNLVEFDPDADADAAADGDDPSPGVDIRRRSLDDVTRDFEFVSVELADGEGVDRVREQLRQRELTDAVAIVELTGEGEPVTPAEVESFALEQGALIVRVTDRREETDVESELSVSFADPDDAVRERVEEMGLSTAARDVDETVRASKVADSNVRERVRDRVRDLLEEPSAFETADRDDGTAEGDESEGETDADGENRESRAREGSDDGGRVTTEEHNRDSEQERERDPEQEPVQEQERPRETTESGASSDEVASDSDEVERTPEGDGQASMEEFL